MGTCDNRLVDALLIEDFDKNHKKRLILYKSLCLMSKEMSPWPLQQLLPQPLVPDDLVGRMDLETALRAVLKAALIHDGLSRGLHETVKALDKRQALLCILAENCDEASYKKLVQALCQEHQIPLLTVPDNMQLGKYAGLCKLDAEGNERKVVRCSSVVVRDWGKEEAAHDFLKEHIKQQRA